MNIRISTKGKRPLRSLTPSDKVHAIQRIHDGESKASVARDIGVPESTLRGWCKNEDKLRFMSRQAAAEKFGNDSLSEKLDGNSMLGGPPEKRQRVDTSMALNFSNKIKFDELNSYKRPPINGLDYSTNKALVDLGNFTSIAPEFGAFNGSAKTKIYGTDISRSTDPSMAAISPLSSLTHLSGLTGINQSPLAISFNELTTNLTLLAQLNPGLAVMSGLTVTGNTLRTTNSKPKSQVQAHSPRSETAERHTGLTVKNWAKQNPSTPTSTDSTSCGLNLCQNEEKTQMKNLITPLTSQLGSTLPPPSSLSEDPLLYWLKSQQAMLGLNNIYPHASVLVAPTSPIRSSTPQQQSLNASTPPIIPNTLTPSSTPSGSLDDKNAAWFNWCKAFGVNLNSLTPAAVVSAIHGSAVHKTPHSSGNSSEVDKQISAKVGFENILYSQLTKDSTSNSSPQSCISVEQVNSDMTQNTDLSNRPEDLSAKSSKEKSPLSTPIPNPGLSPICVEDRQPLNNDSCATNPIPETNNSALDSNRLQVTRNSVADCRDVLDNLLYKINNNPNAPSRMSDSDSSCINDRSDVLECPHNNNNNSNKTDEEEWAKCADLNFDDELDADWKEAIKNGEKFLRWLENCSNPRVTAVQLMQLRVLISSIKGVDDPLTRSRDSISPSNQLTAIEIDDSSEEGNRSKTRRRK